MIIEDVNYLIESISGTWNVRETQMLTCYVTPPYLKS